MALCGQLVFEESVDLPQDRIHSDDDDDHDDDNDDDEIVDSTIVPALLVGTDWLN